MKIIFAGTPEFAAISLKALLAEDYLVTAVYTQPDRPSGRGQKLVPSEVKQVALEHRLPVYQPINFKSQEAIDELAHLTPDLMIVAAYGLILPEAVLRIPRLGCVNIHASLLPRWRGAAPIQRAIEAGDQETGITIMKMDIGLDTGDMFLKKSLPITPSETGGSLHDKLAVLGGEAIVAALPGILNKSLGATPQNNAEANYARKLSKEEGKIDWNLPAQVIERKIRALTPWPVAYTDEGEYRIRIHEAQPGDTVQSTPGTLMSRTRAGIQIACGEDTSLLITRLQLPGSKAISALDLINGNQPVLQLGSVLG